MSFQLYRGRVHESGAGAALHDARWVLGLAGRVDVEHVAALWKVTLAEKISGEEAGEELSEEGDYHDRGAKWKLLAASLRVVERIFEQRSYAESFFAACRNSFL